MRLSDLSKESAFSIDLFKRSLEVRYRDGNLSFQRRSWTDNQIEKQDLAISDLKDLVIVIDRSAVEIFVNQGQYVLSGRYFSLEEEINLSSSQRLSFILQELQA